MTLSRQSTSNCLWACGEGRFLGSRGPSDDLDAPYFPLVDAEALALEEGRSVERWKRHCSRGAARRARTRWGSRALRTVTGMGLRPGRRSPGRRLRLVRKGSCRRSPAAVSERYSSGVRPVASGYAWRYCVCRTQARRLAAPCATAFFQGASERSRVKVLAEVVAARQGVAANFVDRPFRRTSTDVG